MNMISTGAFQTEMDASIKQETLAEKFARVWEKKNSKVARAGGVSLMALSLAACGSDDDTTSTDTSSSSDTTTTTTPAGSNFVLAGTADVITGTAGDDTISGTSGSIDGDTVNAGAGDDTMSVTVSIADDDLAAFAASGLETLQIRGTGAAGGEVDLDLGDVAGMTTLEFRRMAEDVTVTNVQSLSTGLKISDTANAASDVIVNFDAAAVTGSADTATLTVDNVTAGQDFTVNGVETIAVTAVGDDNDINIDGDDLETVTVSGAGEISIDVDASATTFDASASTGDVTMVATAAADVTATGGAGADTFSMAATLTAEDTIAGGAGTDTLAVTGAGGALIPASADVSGIETLTATINGADTLDANVVSFDNINILATAATDDVTITDLTDEVLTLTQLAAGVDIDEVDVSLADATGAADALTVNVANAHTTTIFDVDLIESTGGGIETLTVNLDQGVDLDDADDISIGSITAGTALTITGAADADIGGDAGLTQTTVSAADATGDLTIAIGAATSTVTTGSGDDTIAFGANMTTADTATGGAGDDTLTVTPAASTSIAATLSGIETVTASFGNAGSTVSFLNSDDVTTVNADGAEAVRLTNMDASVTSIVLASTTSDTNDAVTMTHSASAAALTITIGDVLDGTANADVDHDTVSTTYAGALTLLSDGSDTGTNSIDGFDANSATSLVITTDNDLSITGGGDDDVSATSATSISITSNGGDLVIDDDLIADDAETVTLTAADGAITVTDALDVSVADSAVVLTASGADANDITIGDVAIEDMSSLSATASGGADITVTDITAFTGTNSDGDDISTSITLSATGDGTVVTLSDIGSGTSTLDLITIVTADDGVVSATVTDDDVTITAIDATGAAADDLVINVNDLAAATEITLGAGNDATVTLSDNGDTVTTGAGTSTIIVTDGQADITLGSAVDTIRPQQVDDDVQITNFTAGAGGDVIEIDISATTALTNGGSTTAADWFTPVIEDIATGTLTAIADATNIVRVTTVVANSAGMEGVLEDDALNDGNLTAGDDLIVLWTDGANTYISEVDVTTLDTGADGVDAVAATTIATLVGVTIGDLTAANFDFVA